MSQWIIRCGIIVIGILACVGSAAAQTEIDADIIVSPDGAYTTIQSALDAAQVGDTIVVDGGEYRGPVEITNTVRLIGINNPVIDGGGHGSIVFILADYVEFSGFTVRHTGLNLSHEDSAIIVQADYVLVADNIMEEVLYGIYFADANHGVARNNTVVGYDRDIAMRGDGIRVWFSTDVLLEGNTVTDTRDILVWYANNITIRENFFTGNRYAIHFMYSDRATIDRNRFSGNHVGMYLMYSNGLHVLYNDLSYNRGPSGYGIALKDMDEVIIEDNWIAGNRVGLYIDNSPSRFEGYNQIQRNLFAYNDIGVVTLPAVTRNVFQNNAFVENTQQAGTRGRGDLQGNTWSSDGVGNYWSDYAGFDADGDAIGELPYRAERLFETLADGDPVLRFFLYSPAVTAIDFAAAAFPSLRPEPRLIDETPLVSYSLPAVQFAGTPDARPSMFIVVGVLLVSGGVICWWGIRFAQPRRVTPA